jgi:hypothetical protein
VTDAGKQPGKSGPNASDIISRLEKSVERARRDPEFARSVVEAEAAENRIPKGDVAGYAATQFNSLAVARLNSHIGEVRKGNLLSATDRIWRVAAW